MFSISILFINIFLSKFSVLIENNYQNVNSTQTFEPEQNFGININLNDSDIEVNCRLDFDKH